MLDATSTVGTNEKPSMSCLGVTYWASILLRGTNTSRSVASYIFEEFSM